MRQFSVARDDMMQGHSRSREGKQITKKKVVKFRAVNKLVAHGAELVSAAVQHCTRRSITLRDDDESVTGEGNPSLLCRS